MIAIIGCGNANRSDDAAGLESRHVPSLTLHDFRWGHALHAGRKMYREAFPKDVTAHLIEARSLALGCGLSPDIREAALRVADRIARLSATPRGTSTAWAVP